MGRDETQKRYLYSVPGRDESRYYRACWLGYEHAIEAPGGWMICWHRGSGKAHHPVKKLGVFGAQKMAEDALRELAVKMGMKQWVEHVGGRFGYWERVTAREETD